MIPKRNVSEEMKKMQQEAINRVKEIHSKSKPPKVSSNNTKNPNHTPVSPQNENSKASNLKSNNERKNSNFNLRTTKIISQPPSDKKTQPLLGGVFDGITGFMDLLFKDGEKTLILVLIVLLMDSEENFMMLLVMLYLLI